MNKSILAIIGVAIVAAIVFFAVKGQDKVDLVTGGLRVTSPNGGEILKAGVNQDIIWEASSDATENTGSIYAQSSIATEELYTIAEGIDLNSEGFGWKVGDVLRNSRIIRGAVPAGEYKIKVCYDVSGACDVSDGYFTLTE